MATSVKLYINKLQSILSPEANHEKALGAAAYMKNQFTFLGIAMPVRTKICKEYIKQNPFTYNENLNNIVKDLWNLPEREYQYFAIELMAFYKKVWSEEIIVLFEYCLVHKSWWDTVDFINSDCTGPYFMLYPKNTQHITLRWNNSKNIWLQRSSLLFQKSCKQQTDVDLLSKYILNLSTSKEFFIRKAIGWVLREYANTNPEWVIEFVNTHEMSALSKREALKNVV